MSHLNPSTAPSVDSKIHVRKWHEFLVLPRHVTDAEAEHLRRVNGTALRFFWAHVPVFSLIAFANGTGAAAAFGLTTFVVAGPTLLARVLPVRAMSLIFGFVAMCLGGLLVHFGQGMVQIEMHFYFFVLLALLAVFGNPMAIVVAAVTVALHHVLLWAILPASVFNYAAPLWVVAVHAGFVVLESVAACYVARSFFDNVIGLEKIVAERTAELDKKNGEMRLILNTVRQGLIVVKRGGQMSPERSAILTQWLGSAAPGETFFSWLARSADPEEVSWLRLAFDAVFDDVLPREVSLDQLPREIKVGGRTLELDVRVMDEPETAMLALSDVTTQRLASRAALAQQEAGILIEHLVRDRQSVTEFVEECGGMLKRLIEGRANTAESRRLAHTIKGNAAMFGLQRVVEAAQSVEGHIIDDGLGEGAADALNALAAAWHDSISGITPFISDDGRLDVTKDDLEQLCAKVAAGAPPAALAESIRALGDERGVRRLDRLAEHARNLAARIGKEVVVEVRCTSALRSPAGLQSFWSATVHLLRNAIDHGIESPSQRVAVGKDPRGHLSLAFDDSGAGLTFTIADDGSGIPWPRVEAAAAERGIPHASPEQLMEALFCEGLSTKGSVDEISGRGIGLPALRAAARACGGEVSVTSSPHRGTAITVHLPHSRPAGPPRPTAGSP